MTTEELLHRYGPVPSMRKQMLGYLHSHFPRACSTEEVAEHIGTTSNFGPGRAEVCTVRNVRPLWRPINHYLRKKKLPFEVIRCDRDHFRLAAHSSDSE
jgi:hypothetical protein